MSIGLWAALLGSFAVASACTEEGSAPVQAAQTQSAATATGQPSVSGRIGDLAAAADHGSDDLAWLPANKMADDECCEDVGQANECWLEDAADDGIICPSNDAAEPGSPVCLSSLGCDPTGRVCQCESDDDCCDDANGDGVCEGERQGVCVIEAGDSSGLCGPSWCNGYKVCSCWGGCINATPGTTPEDNCNAAGLDVCCDGTYSILPGAEDDPVGTGFCSDNPNCGTGCSSDAECPNDSNPCTDPYCDLATGLCGFVDNTDPCNADSNGCTMNDTCEDGECVAGPAPNCDDTPTSNICTTDVCHSLGNNSYECQHIDNTLECNADSDGCTVGDACSGGSCLPGPAEDCTGANLCVDDFCVSLGAELFDCDYTYNTDSCDDSDACTQNDTCDLGTCVGDVIDCDDSNLCTDDSCDHATGCVNTNDDTNVCTDSNACTSDDHCSAGACVGDAVTCDDGNPCTDDSCDAATGCVYTNDDTNTCDDGNACTSADHCSAGSCVGTVVTCDDSNQCTDDVCNPASGCVYTNDNTNICNDSNACTSADHCSAGACVGTAVTCNDANDCTDDTCNPASGCVYANDDTNTCDDSDACTSADHCVAGSCEGTTVTCNDSNQCTDDSCDPATGCVYTNDNTNVCTDSNACTSADHCSAGACVGTAVTCNDANACTDDTCNPATGCVYTNDNTNTCNDSNACTSADHCSAGACVGTAVTCNDANDCTDDTCNTSTGCVYTNDNTNTCNDSNACTSADHCSAGSCVGTAVTCNDSNDCTDDTCNTSTGCVYTNDNTNACSDGDACTTSDHCTAGACSGTTINCDDSNVCTNDSCSSGSCVHANNTDSCNDGDLCTTGDVCSGGACGGTPVNCDDSNVCTTDSCVAATGACSHTAIAGCCLADSECTAACPSSANTTCNLEYCDSVTHQCVCDPTYGYDNNLTCALDTNQYPENCYIGECALDGDCDPLEIQNSGSDLCRTMFDTGDIYTLDETKPSYLGWFQNGDQLGHLVGGTTASRLEKSGSTECGNNNYEATGKSCKEEGASSLSSVNLGTSGKDAVFVFEYQVNDGSEYQLYSYQIEVQANFNVGIYLKTDIDNADECPEGVNESPNGHYSVPSNRCYVAYSGAKAVLQDRCMDGNATYSPSQVCCNPLRGTGVPGTVTCSGSTATSPTGYYWCYRPYPAGCCGYTNGEYCDGSASDLGTKCTGSYWTYPADPYDSSCTNDNASFPTTNLATATVYPDGATDGTWRKVFVFVDGVNYPSAGGGLEGDFYITVKKTKWYAGPCDRTNDDMRVFDITHAGSGSTYLGTLANTVNSIHNGSGSCGGYNCANSWTGVTGCHVSSSANEFWPNTESFMIARAPGTGSQMYCLRTDESIASAADLTLSVERISATAASVCSATVTSLGCDHTTGTGASGGISTEFTASDSYVYQVNLSNYNKLDRPCGAQSTYGCRYKFTVNEGPCCDSGPLEASKGTFTIDNTVYGSLSVTGQSLESGDGNQYSDCSSYPEETWTITNTTGSPVSAKVTVQPTTSWDVDLGLFDCKNDNILCEDYYGNGTADSFTYTFDPGQTYYLAVNNYSSGVMGTYNVSVTWGTPMTCVAPSFWATPYSGALTGTINWTGAATTISGNSCSAPPYAGTSYSNFSSGYDEMWQINISADTTITFTGCTSDGYDSNFDTLFALYDCMGNMIASSDDGCDCGFLCWEYNSWIRKNLQASKSPYYLVIDGYDSGECGTYSVGVQ